MAAETVRVTGFREYIGALQRIDKGASLVVRGALREVAKPIASSAQAKLAGYNGISLGTIGPKVTVSGVNVTQRAKKVTGQRPDFGALQMTRGLIPALEEHAGDLEDKADKALAILIASAGFH